MFKVNNKNTKHQNIIDVVLVFLLLTLTYFTPFYSVSTVGFVQVNVRWEELSTINCFRKKFQSEMFTV